MASRFVIFIKLFLCTNIFIYFFIFHFIVVLPPSIQPPLTFLFIDRKCHLYICSSICIVAVIWKEGNSIAICLLWMFSCCFSTMYYYFISFTFQLSYSILQFQKAVSCFRWNFRLPFVLLCTF